MTSNLKTPAEFNGKASEDSVLLKNPTNFTSKLNLGLDKRAKIENQDISRMKKPSDFTVNPLLSKQSISKKVLNKQVVEPPALEKREVSKNSILSKQLSHVDEQFYKESIRKLQKSITDKDLDWKLSEEKWKTKLKAKEQEVADLTNKLDETKMHCQMLSSEHNNKDSKYFLEVKSVYEKYINLQQQFDSEKNKLLSKIDQLECQKAALKSENNFLKDAIKDGELKVTFLNNQVSEIQNSKVSIAQEQEKEKDEYLQMIEHLNVENGELKKRCNSLKDDNTKFSNEIITKEHLIKEMSLELKAQKSLLSTKGSEISSLMQENLDVCNEKKMLEEKHGDICNELHCLKEKYHNEMTEYGYTQNELTKMKNILDETKFELVAKTKDIFELEKTCNTLQCSNKQLNLQSEALSELLKLQDNVLSLSKTNKIGNAVVLWRQKVYQLLVLLKSKEMDEF
ncbi:putative leucine-rich repeat-containing protein DDB_G0290503 [Clytia hemisphaerica]|uniref:Uncharacterized protein n=1 Tax=Clytia hemisphaerica TaxID=252671 RepID=A0A7M5V8D7_9CNID|eukprot:TCONS_00050683-protein